MKLFSLDFYLSLSSVAYENKYVRPTFNDKKTNDIDDARYSKIYKANPESIFVFNDYKIDTDDDILIITGLNLVGKSTYMKEIGFIIILY